MGVSTVAQQKCHCFSDLVIVSLRSVLVTIQCVLVPIGFDCVTAPIQFV